MTDFDLGVGTYLVMVAVGAYLGLRAVHGVPTKARRNALIALYDLLWVLVAIVGIVATFSQVGKVIWQFGVSESASTNARFLESLQRISSTDVVTRNCKDKSFNPRQGTASLDRFETFLEVRPCMWSRELDSYVAQVKQANLDVEALCSGPIKSEMNARLFMTEGERFFNACGLLNLAESPCGNAYCRKQRATYATHRMILEMPDGIDKDATLEKISLEQSQARSPLNKQIHDSLQPFGALSALIYLIPLSFLLGLRIAKAVYDYCDKVETGKLTGGHKLFLLCWVKLRLYREMPQEPPAGRAPGPV